MVLLHACGLEQPMMSGKFFTQCGLTNKPPTSSRDIQGFLFYIAGDIRSSECNFLKIVTVVCLALPFQPTNQS